MLRDQVSGLLFFNLLYLELFPIRIDPREVHGMDVLLGHENKLIFDFLRQNGVDLGWQVAWPEILVVQVRDGHLAWVGAALPFAIWQFDFTMVFLP